MRRRLIIPWIAVLALALGLPIHTAAQDNTSAQITSPKAGDSLFGPVSIQGTASNPNMQRYVLQFDAQDDSADTWLPIGGPITQQVNNGILGLWNTTTIPDGRYRIRLRVVLRDGTVLDAVVENLQISNKQPTPLPTALPPATNTAVPLPPTAGPSATPLIQQPPTSTAHSPTETPVPVVAAQPVDSGTNTSQVGNMLTALGNAFCNGFYLALAVFVIVGLYSLVHVRVRPVIQRLMRQLRNG